MLMFGTGTISNVYNTTIGRWSMNVQRENFKHSKSYVESMISDLSQYKKELDRETDPITRKGIINFIDEYYANFDDSLIDNSTLRYFLQDIRNGVIE